MKWIALLMFGSVGLTCFVAGLVWGAKRLALMKDGVKATGKIIDMSESVSNEGSGTRTRTSRAYYPEVEFTAADGKTYRFRGSTGSGSPSYEMGAKVDLVYNRDNPSVAQITDFEQFWLGPLGIGLFGFLFLVAGIGSFFLIADSDKTFGPAFEATMARASLKDGKQGIPLSAVVKEIRKVPVKGQPDHYVVVVRGGAPGGAEREFTSAELSFDPGNPIIGKTVTVFADMQDADRYYVDLDPLFKKDW